MTARVFRRVCLAAALLAASACASAPKPETGAGPAAPVVKPAPAPSAPKPQPSAAPSSAAFKPDPVLSLCPAITVSNAPATEADRKLADYKPFAVAAPGVLLAISPVSGACLTSGFGQRAGGLHKGIDLQSKPPNMVHAAGKGRIVEAGFRADYGNYVLIDHGQGVFTRYAHMQALEPGVAVGASIPFGAPLGVMGSTAGYSIPIHLHFETLTGNYDTPKKAFGLTPVDILSLPRSG